MSTERANTPVTRIELADHISSCFDQSGPVSRAELLSQAARRGARPQAVELLAELPDIVYWRLRDLWEHLGRVPIEQ